MKRVLAALCALAGASGCYGTTYVETPAPQYGTTMEYIPEAPPQPISVTVAPPAPRYESVLTCGYGTIYVPGRWEWTGRWYWARGYCSPVRPGHIYVGPRFVGGVYYRAHWAPSGYGAALLLDSWALLGRQDLRAADFPRQALGVVDRRGAADVVLEVALEFGDEGRIGAQFQVGRRQLGQRRHQGLGHEHAAVVAETTAGVGVGMKIDRSSHAYGFRRQARAR